MIKDTNSTVKVVVSSDVNDALKKFAAQHNTSVSKVMASVAVAIVNEKTNLTLDEIFSTLFIKKY